VSIPSRIRSVVFFGLLAVACSAVPDAPARRVGALSARPHAPTLPCPAGFTALGLDAARGAVLYVPQGVASSGAPAPLLVFLHGAGGNPARGLERMRPLADAKGVILLVPRSRGDTWDAIRGSLGPDVAFVDRSLDATFDRCAVDASHIGVSGFSDGASYALTLGIANGDLFTHVVAQDSSPCRIRSAANVSGSSIDGTVKHTTMSPEICAVVATS